ATLLIERQHLEAEQADGLQPAVVADGVGGTFVNAKERVLERGSQQFVLAGEVVFQTAVGEPGLRGDLAHGGRGEASARDDAPRRFDDFDAALIVVDNPGHLLPSSVADRTRSLLSPR